MPRPLLALFGCLIILTTACSSAQGVPATAHDDRSSPASLAVSAPSIAASASPAAAVPSPAFADPRLAACQAHPATAAALVPLAHAFDYRPVLPSLGFQAALDARHEPALLVVYGGISPLRPPLVVDPPNGGPPITYPPSPLPPGTSDVCVVVEGVAKPYLFQRIADAPIHPELAGAPRQPAKAGEARVVASTTSGLWNVAWDPVHRFVWGVSELDWKGALTAIDPATHRVRTWPLPASPSLQFPSATGSSQSIAVDVEGGVWFEASGYNLYRFDLATQHFHTVHLELKTGHWRGLGSYILAIVPYDGGVLVARRGVPILYRYDSTMRVIGSVPLDPQYTVSREVTRGGSNIVIRGIKWLALFDTHGRRIRQLLYPPDCSLFGAPQVSQDDRRRAVICHGDEWLLLDRKGGPVGAVNPPLDAATAGMSSVTRTYHSVGAYATDWRGRWWFVDDACVVQVNAP